MKIKVLITIACISTLGCYDPEDYDTQEFNADNYNNYLTITSEKDSIEANGSASTTILASISKNANPELREIEFTTSKGIFTLNGTKTIKVRADEFDPNNSNKIVAAVQLRSDNSEGTAQVIAKVKYLEQSVSTKFFRVYPEKINIESNSFYITQHLSSSDTVVATLQRSFGIPTSGQKVDFFVINEHQDTVVNTIKETGFYRAHTMNSDVNGKVSIIFSLGDNTYLGNLKIVGYLKRPDGKILKDSTNIKVTL